jgi:hypothetical protein
MHALWHADGVGICTFELSFERCAAPSNVYVYRYERMPFTAAKGDAVARTHTK